MSLDAFVYQNLKFKLTTIRLLTYLTIRLSMNMPQLSMSMPQLSMSMPQLSMSMPQLSMSMPQLSMSMPQLSMSMPQLSMSMQVVNEAQPSYLQLIDNDSELSNWFNINKLKLKYYFKEIITKRGTPPSFTTSRSRVPLLSYPYERGRTSDTQGTKRQSSAIVLNLKMDTYRYLWAVTIVSSSANQNARFVIVGSTSWFILNYIHTFQF